MAQKVLSENWTDYDNKKIRDYRDAKDFACSESWEVDYLVNKISKVSPQYSEIRIRQAIKTCCSTIRAPHPRKAFVECVMERLKG